MKLEYVTAIMYKQVMRSSL